MTREAGYVPFAAIRDGRKIDAVLDRLDVPFERRGEIREFAMMDTQQQLVWLYVLVTRPAPAPGTAPTAVFVRAAGVAFLSLAYALAQYLSGWRLPPFGGSASADE